MGIKQDRPRVRTAYDLEQKYKFGTQIELMKEMKKAISKAEQELANMKSGEYTTTVSVFFEPGAEEVETIEKHINKEELIPEDKIDLYIFKGYGITITDRDLTLAREASEGLRTLSTWEGAIKSEVAIKINLSSPENLIKITGTNMWGRDIKYNAGEFVGWLLAENELFKKRLEDIEDELFDLTVYVNQFH